MAQDRPPEVVRERVDSLPGGRVSGAVVFDRELSREEIARFYLVEAGARPYPMDFDVAGRVVSWECRRDEADRWRLELEIFLVKSFRSETRAPLKPDSRRREPTAGG